MKEQHPDLNDTLRSEGVEGVCAAQRRFPLAAHARNEHHQFLNFCAAYRRRSGVRH